MIIFNHHVFGCSASIKAFIRRFCIVDAQPELQCCVAHWALWDQEGGQSAVKMVMKVQFKGFRIQGRWDIKVVRNVCARKPFPDIASSFLFAFSQERSVVIPPSDTFSNFDKNFQLLSPHLIHFQLLFLIWYFHKSFQLLSPYLIHFPMFTKNFQLLSPIWYFRKSIQSLSHHLIPFPILKSVWRPHMPFSKSKIMQELNPILIE